MSRTIPALRVTTDNGLQVGASNVTTLNNTAGSNISVNLPASADTLVGRATADTLTNKTLDDASTVIKDHASTAQLKHTVGAVGAGNTVTLIFSGSGTNTVTIPNSTDTLAARATADTFTNKTITDSTNNVNAKGLFTGTGVVSIGSASAPSAGQTLIATGPTAAAWTLPIPNVAVSGATATTSDATVTVIESLATADNTVYVVNTRIGARRTDTPGTYGGFVLNTTYSRGTGAASLARVGAGDDLLSEISAGQTWTVDSNANTGTGVIELRVTGAAAQTISWRSTTQTLAD